jgi:hypothetical protein
MANTSISLTTATGGDARVLRFPGQSGSRNPGVATLVLFDESGRHVFDVRAEGEVRVDRSDRLGLTFSEHQPGQIAGYLEAEPWGTYERTAIDSGAVEADAELVQRASRYAEVATTAERLRMELGREPTVREIYAAVDTPAPEPEPESDLRARIDRIVTEASAPPPA